MRLNPSNISLERMRAEITKAEKAWDDAEDAFSHAVNTIYKGPQVDKIERDARIAFDKFLDLRDAAYGLFSEEELRGSYRP